MSKIEESCGIIKNIKIGDYIVSICFKKPIYIKNNNTIVFGYPVENKSLLFQSWNDIDRFNDISGYYCAIRIEEDSINIVNDIVGNYRVYYSIINHEIIVSDYFPVIIDFLKKRSVLKLTDIQLEYWNDHRTTLGESTLYCNLKKMLPATILKITSDGLRTNGYFRNVEHKASFKKHISTSYKSLKQTILTAYEENSDKKFLLFYSGGADSTLLFNIMKELDISFSSIIIKFNPAFNGLEKDYAEAEQNLKKMGAKDVRVIEVDIRNNIENHINYIKDEMLFDRHISIHFYETYRKIVEIYGKDVVIVNGQSADSILSFGPTWNTIGGYVKRLIIASRGVLRYLLYLLSKNKDYYVPFKKDEIYYSMLDDQKYMFVKDRSGKYGCIINDVLENKIVKKIENHFCKIYYLKILSFLQGPDNQIVINSANHFGISKILMPFATPSFIYSTIKYKNNWLDVIVAKYPVKFLLKHYYKYKRISQNEIRDKDITNNIIDLDEIEKEVNDTFKKCINSYDRY